MNTHPTLERRLPRLNGEASNDFAPLKDPQILDRYHVVRELPVGGMGIVVHAQEKSLGREVVLKFIRPELLAGSGARQQFQLEAKAIAQSKHPHVVKLYEFNPEYPYLSLEYLPLGDLGAYIKQHGAIESPHAVQMMFDLADALHTFHQRGQLHRDIKPSNILLDKGRDGQLLAKLGDFGITQLVATDEHPVTNSLKGTWEYMAPELFGGAAPTPYSDQWSLAATCYHLLTGQSGRILMFQAKLLPEQIRPILYRALHNDPEQRYPSVQDFAEELLAADSGEVHVTSAVQIDFGTESSVLRLKRERQRAAQLHEQSRELVTVQHDYDGAIRLLEPLPEAARDAHFYAETLCKANRVRELREGIEQASLGVPPRRLARQVLEYLELKPDDTEMRELQAELPPIVRPGPVSAPFNASEAYLAQRQWADWIDCEVEWMNSIGMRFRLIPPGEFLMGSDSNDKTAASDEKPQHRVQISRPFFMGMFAVTQGEYKSVTGTAPSQFDAGGSITRWQLPVEQVSFEDVLKFLTTLNGRQGELGLYRLPWEAEWEYSCRAGTTSPYWWGSGLNGTQANCDGHNPYGSDTRGPRLQRTTPGGTYAPNPWGLFDMGGNVWQWCADWYGEVYYEFSPFRDPQGPNTGSSKVRRGGCWYDNAIECRSVNRSFDSCTIRNNRCGFRLVRETSES